MKFPFLFKATEITITTTTSAAPSWPWPSCTTNPKTLSFRANASDNIYKTINSAYLDDKNTPEFADDNTSDSFFSISKSFEHCHEEISSFESEISDLEQLNNVESAVFSALMSERLFFEPGETNSIMKKDKTHKHLRAESVAMVAIVSSDPFIDFRVSMEEMVEACGLKDWIFLEELLECYLRVNDKSNHGYIVGAFVDLFNNLALISASNDSLHDEKCSSSSTNTRYSLTSLPSFSSSTTYSSTSPCLCSLENEGEIAVEKNGDSSSSTLLFNASSSGV